MTNDVTTDSSTPAETAAPAAKNAHAKPQQGKAKNAGKKRPQHPLLLELARLHPALFGASPKPLKRGIYDDLQAAHPDMDAEALKLALGEHTRSTRYLQGVAASQPRHDLEGQAVESMAVEHVFHAMVEIFRRKQKRGNASEAEKQEAREWLSRRLRHSIDASGLTAQAYAETVRTKEPTAKAVLEEVTAELIARAAKDEALLSAFESGKTTVHEFAEMYGFTAQEAGLILARARIQKLKAQTPIPASTDEASA